jgi:hypothetical protein
MAEFHLAKQRKLFRQTEPALKIPSVRCGFVAIHVPVAAPAERDTLLLGNPHDDIGQPFEGLPIVPVIGEWEQIEGDSRHIVMGRLAKLRLALPVWKARVCASLPLVLSRTQKSISLMAFIAISFRLGRHLDKLLSDATPKTGMVMSFDCQWCLVPTRLGGRGWQDSYRRCQRMWPR